MQFKQTKFEIYRQDSSTTNWANYTKENHLQYNAYVKPTEIGMDAVKFMATVKSLSRGITPLLDLTKGKGKTVKIKTSDWQWKLYGIPVRPAFVLEDYEPTNVTKGIHLTKFKIKLDCGFYVIGDVIVPDGPKIFQCRVQEDPIPDGNGFIYTLQLATDEKTLFLPQKFVQPGIKWRKLFSTYGEGRVGAGSTMFNELPHFIMRSWLSHVAKKYRITGDAARNKLVITPMIYDKGNQSIKKGGDMWTTWAEMIADQEWKMEEEYLLMYSRSTRSIIDEQTGSKVNQGPGLQELLEEGNIEYYNKFSIRLVTDFLRGIFFNRVGFENRDIYMLTGQVGIEMFSDSIKYIANGNYSDTSQFFIEEVKGKNARSQGGSLAFGNNYTRYNMQWGTLNVVHFPQYDNTEIHTQINPDTGLPVESQRFTFLNLGLGDGLSGDNLSYMEREGSETFGYMCGTHTPYGPNSGQFPMSYPGDYFDIYRSKQMGIQLTDPKLTGELIFNLQY